MTEAPKDFSQTVGREPYDVSGTEWVEGYRRWELEKEGWEIERKREAGEITEMEADFEAQRLHEKWAQLEKGEENG